RKSTPLHIPAHNWNAPAIPRAKRNINSARPICWPLSPPRKKRRRKRDKSVLYLYSKEFTMLAVRLPQSIEKRLEKLARRTGRTKTYYVREAILEHLEDLEDLYLAERVLERIRSGEERTIPLKDAMKRHGLER